MRPVFKILVLIMFIGFVYIIVTDIVTPPKTIYTMTTSYTCVPLTSNAAPTDMNAFNSLSSCKREAHIMKKQ